MDQDEYGLVGDIGGTHARFGLVRRQEVTEVCELRCADFEGLASALEAYFKSKLGGASANSACIAVATPVLGDRVSLTNSDWAFSIESTRARFGLRELRVVNDFAALARSVPLLGARDLDRVWLPPSSPRAAKAPCLVMGPGTGLGMASVVNLQGRWHILPGEGGHMTLPAQTPADLELLRVLWRDYSHVSAERLLSGTGLPLLHRALAVVRGTPGDDLPDAAAVVNAARYLPSGPAGDTLRTFSRMLGVVAGNAVLTLGASGGVYLAGGVLGKLGELFDKQAFVEGYAAKGRFSSYVSAVPVHHVVHPYPALLGAQALLEDHAAGYSSA